MDVEIKYADDLVLRVRDNGSGIDPDIAEPAKDGHFGIRGMRERADRICGKLTLVSSPNNGTEVMLVVPGAIIFQPTFGGREHHLQGSTIGSGGRAKSSRPEL